MSPPTPNPDEHSRACPAQQQRVADRHGNVQLAVIPLPLPCSVTERGQREHALRMLHPNGRAEPKPLCAVARTINIDSLISQCPNAIQIRFQPLLAVILEYQHALNTPGPHDVLPGNPIRQLTRFMLVCADPAVGQIREDHQQRKDNRGRVHPPGQQTPEPTHDSSHIQGKVPHPPPRAHTHT